MVAPVVVAAIPAVLDFGVQLIDRLFPDPKAAESAKLALLKMQLDGQLAEMEFTAKLAEAQTQTNNIDATSTNPFQSGWRPFIGWVCGGGLAYQFLFRPLFNFVLLVADKTAQMPALELETLMTLLFGILGLGAYRSFEKVRGVAS
jgi:hypothetical protein